MERVIAGGLQRKKQSESELDGSGEGAVKKRSDSEVSRISSVASGELVSSLSFDFQLKPRPIEVTPQLLPTLMDR